MAKVISIDKDVSNYNGDSWKLADYPSFAETDNAEEWLGVDSISLERAKELAFELGGDEAYDIEDEINSATDLDELQDALSELKYFQRDNTYNSSWWGGVVNYGVLTEDGEGYGKGLVLLSMHKGGDPRGNYYDMKAFELDSYIENFPPYFARLTYTIKTDEGDLMLDTEDMEGYSMYVVSDETGTFEEGDYINLDDVESAFEMEGNSFYSFGGGVAVGGLLGAYLGYKIGRARPQKKGFSTEKKVGQKIKSAFSKKKYDGGGDVQGVMWDKDSESIRTQLGEFVVLIYPQSQKGYYDVYVSANKKKVGSKNDIYGLDKAKDVAYDIIGNANKQFAQGGDVPMNVGIGSTIVFMSSNGDKREGEIISKLDENSWEVSHSFGVAMVKNNEIIEVTQKSGRKKLFGIFDNGGGVDSMYEEDAMSWNDKQILKYRKQTDDDRKETHRHYYNLYNDEFTNLWYNEGGREKALKKYNTDDDYTAWKSAFEDFIVEKEGGRYDNGGDVRDFSWYQDFKPKGQQSRQNDDELREVKGKAYYVTDKSLEGTKYYFDDLVDAEFNTKRYFESLVGTGNVPIRANRFTIKVKNQSDIIPEIKKYFTQEGYFDNQGRVEIIGFLLSPSMESAKFNDELPYDIYSDEDEDYDEYARGGNVNTGRSWHLDRARHNKRENYEIPMNSRKKRYDNGGGVNSMEDYNNRLYAMSNDEFANEYARVYTNESRRDVLNNLNEDSKLYKPMYAYELQLNNKVNSRKQYGQGGGVMNRQYLSSLPQEKKMVILNNIAKHYGVLVEDIENEVTDDEAENLYEYIANDNSLRMNVYNDFQRMSNKYAKGGLTEHGLQVGDKIRNDYSVVYPNNKSFKGIIDVTNKDGEIQIVNLDKGQRFDNGGGVDYPNHYLEVDDLNRKINALTQQIESDYRNNEIDNYTDRNERELDRLKQKLDFLMYGKDSYAQGGNIDDLIKG
jgi:hypothetical protein